jgi:hypothetical protein
MAGPAAAPASAPSTAMMNASAARPVAMTGTQSTVASLSSQ